MNRKDDDSSTPTLADLDIPEPGALLEHLNQLAEQNDALGRAIEALSTGCFTDPDGQSESLGEVKNPLEQVALLSWLAKQCQSPMSIEIGFGMGITGCVILASRAQMESPFNHLIYDPFGLSDNRGAVIETFLQNEFGSAYQRMRVRSQFGIGELTTLSHQPECDLIFVDGDHHFEGVMADFFACDKLIRIGGLIVMDDASFPAVETVVNFVRSNRNDYQVVTGEIKNTAILKKTGKDTRSWDHFTPFDVPQRSDWTPSPSL